VNNQSSFPKRLFRSSVFGPVLLGLILLIVAFFMSRQLEHIVADEMTGRALAEVETAFLSYLRPVEAVVDFCRSLGMEGYFEDASVAERDRFFTSLLDTIPQVNSVHVAGLPGEEYMLRAEGIGKYQGRLSNVEDLGWIVERRWQTGEPPREERIESDYDPRTRPWFEGALDALRKSESGEAIDELLVWTDPYQFFTTGEPGVTASLAYETLKDQTELLAFDVLLADVLTFAEVEQERSGALIILMLRDPNQNLVVLANPQETAPGGSPHAYPVPASELEGMPRALIDEAFEDGVPVLDEAFHFRDEKGGWWGAASLSPVSGNRELWVACAIPSSQISRGIPEPYQIVLFVVVFTLAVLFLQRRYLELNLPEEEIDEVL